jgi:hypothetical protein
LNINSDEVEQLSDGTSSLHCVPAAKGPYHQAWAVDFDLELQSIQGFDVETIHILQQISHSTRE